ncbi:MFS transporter [Prosthecobacter sp.]|uniref:MFS transporter n=1 Tax=Prosthecobacter sp. TaxID=1965333 RepID=UPI0025DEC992|nr:MFS transporter [Prosthecobacter sp.]
MAASWMPEDSALPPHAHHPPIVRRNFVCHCFEGGLYMGGLAFLQPETVMPKMVEQLGGRSSIVAIMPALLPAAFALAGLFVSPVVEKLTHFKPWVMSFGLLQRLPYLVTGLLLWNAQDAGPWLLPVVVLTPVASGLVGGVGVVAWMEMVTRMVPERIRAAGWASRYIIQACIGMGAGAVIHQVLTHLPGQRGYALLHLIAFGFLFLSWLAQVFMRELPCTHHHAPHHTGSYWRYLRGLPSLLRSQPQLLKMIAARFTGTGYLMLVSFLTLHALHTTGRPEADEGHFVSFQNIGTILGSMLAAWLGYHSGGKVLLILSRIICVILCAWVSVTESFSGFTAAYFVFGFGLFLDRVGDLTLTAELCPPDRRSTLQAVLSFCNVWSLLLATSLGGLIYTFSGSFYFVAMAAAAFSLVSIVVLSRIPEPRERR